MADDPSGSAATGRGTRVRRGPGFLPALIGFALAALIGGVAGGLIVKATWDSGSGNGGNEAVESNWAAAACRASNVADEASPRL